MLNLLPQSEKKFLEREKCYKTLLILGLAVLCALVCLNLILLSIKIYISAQTEVENIIFQQTEKQIQNSRTRGIEDAIRITNKDMADMHSFYKNKTDMSELLEKLSEILPQGIYLTYFSFSAEQESEREISISGFSPSREKLFELKQILESETEFQEVYFPSSNWVKPYDIDFSLKFHL
jgi:Tfp pilus assembly protein PilN